MTNTKECLHKVMLMEHQCTLEYVLDRWLTLRDVEYIYENWNEFFHHATEYIGTVVISLVHHALDTRRNAGTT